MLISYTPAAKVVREFSELLRHGCKLSEADVARLIEAISPGQPWECRVNLHLLNTMMKVAGAARNAGKTDEFGLEGWEETEKNERFALVHSSYSGRISIQAIEEEVAVRIHRGGEHEGAVAVEVISRDGEIWEVTKFEPTLVEGREDVLKFLWDYIPTRRIRDDDHGLSAAIRRYFDKHIKEHPKPPNRRVYKRLSEGTPPDVPAL